MRLLSRTVFSRRCPGENLSGIFYRARMFSSKPKLVPVDRPEIGGIEAAVAELL